MGRKRTGNELLSRTLECSIIAAEALHRRVRDGNGCCVLAMVTSPKNGQVHRRCGNRGSGRFPGLGKAPEGRIHERAEVRLRRRMLRIWSVLMRRGILRISGHPSQRFCRDGIRAVCRCDWSARPCRCGDPRLRVPSAGALRRCSRGCARSGEASSGPMRGPGDASREWGQSSRGRRGGGCRGRRRPAGGAPHRNGVRLPVRGETVVKPHG